LIPLKHRSGEVRLSFFCQRCDVTFQLMAIPADLYNREMEHYETLVAESKKAHVRSIHAEPNLIDEDRMDEAREVLADELAEDSDE